jgi:hypothetical protein
MRLTKRSLRSDTCLGLSTGLHTSLLPFGNLLHIQFKLILSVIQNMFVTLIEEAYFSMKKEDSYEIMHATYHQHS